MNSLDDRWDQSRDGNNSIRITGTRKNHSNKSLNIRIHTYAKFLKNGQEIDNSKGFIGTGYPVDNSPLTSINGYAKENVLLYYIDLYDNNPNLLRDFCGVRCP